MIATSCSLAGLRFVKHGVLTFFPHTQKTSELAVVRIRGVIMTSHILCVWFCPGTLVVQPAQARDNIAIVVGFGLTVAHPSLSLARGCQRPVLRGLRWSAL